MKQSSIEILVNAINKRFGIANCGDMEKEIQQAKELHKQEIEYAHLHNRCLEDQSFECSINAIENSKQYYKNTFEKEESETYPCPSCQGGGCPFCSGYGTIPK